MPMKVKYVGPKDFKTYNGQRFPRLMAVEVPTNLASVLLSDPMSFLPADQEVPDDVLAQREALPLALEREGHDRIEQYRRKLYEAEMLPAGAIDENTGKPDATMQKRIDSIKGAQDEINAGEALIEQAKKLRARIASEKAIASAESDRPAPGGDDDPPPAARRRRSEAVAV